MPDDNGPELRPGVGASDLDKKKLAGVRQFTFAEHWIP